MEELGQSIRFSMPLNSTLRHTTVLTIAGSDPSGGAGVQSDILTIAALGCHPTSVITTLTIQNTLGVNKAHDVDPHIVASQIRTVMDDIYPRAVKIGMINTSKSAKVIAKTLEQYDIEHLIVDPIVSPSYGQSLMQEGTLDVIKHELLPIASLVTPNIDEAQALSGIKIDNKDDIEEAARRILLTGCKAVLIKGGHLKGAKIDRLYGAVRRDYTSNEVQTHNTHGTGCILSAAITTFLARGEMLDMAVKHAKEFLTQALLSGTNLHTGHGVGTPYRLFEKILPHTSSQYDRCSIENYRENYCEGHLKVRLFENKTRLNGCEVQFITHKTSRISYLQGALMALEGGCKWIQLRMKDASDEEIFQIATTLLPHCKDRKAKLIIDDRVNIVAQTHADGVHLGRGDMSLRQARSILGDNAIIGATVNNFANVEKNWLQGADYIGCGPWRNTSTKAKLAPILGKEECENICRIMKLTGLSLPIVAIGGITIEDIDSVYGAGMSGIAVSGAVLNADDPVEMMRQIIKRTKEIRYGQFS